MNRRNILLSGAALAGLSALALGRLPSAAAQATAGRQDLGVQALGDHLSAGHVLGDPQAPVTIKEYSSLTCPHCANFHTTTLPSVKKNWIDTGKAKLIYHHYPLDRLALIAGLSADCLESDQAYFAYINLLFETQQSWARAAKPVDALAKTAALAGLGRKRFDQCVADETKMDQIIAEMKAGRDDYDIQATPTFIVNGKKLEGAVGYEDFAKALNEAYLGS
jgi:protein-disulfide isomerase